MTIQRATRATSDSTTKTLLPLALAALLMAAPAALTGAAAPGAEALAPAAGTVTVTGTSTLHDWSVRATGLRGSLDLPAGFLAGETSAVPAAKFTLPVRSLQSEHDKMNKLMWESLAAAKHPELTFALESARLKGPGGPTAKVEVKGSLTVAGVARPVALVLDVRRDGNRLLASGELPLKMSDFGIDPPTAMMGTMRTGDAVRVKIETTLTPGS
ncbi:MAG TPA: YceI family protein [Thermoanaerobaculia bacterium]|nr:YceI family protein [Thermoanaerobaculia bacterium]